MSELLSYLIAQARRRPLATARFVSSEVWRRARLHTDASPAPRVPKLEVSNLAARFACVRPAAADVESFPRTHPEAAASILAEADQICRHEIQMFGERVALGKTIDWHADWRTGGRWPLLPVGQIRVVGVREGADIKRPWELARFHHLLPLAQAFALSGEPRYVSEFRAQVLDWIESNPFPLGIHWAMPMEAAIRGINLASAAAWFARSEALDSAFWQQFLSSLYLHGRRVYANREWNPVARGNHYLSCVAGLCVLGALFRDTAEGRRWLTSGRRALAAEMNAQVGADGVAHEGSSGYHLFVTELLLTAAVVLARLDAVERNSNGASGGLRSQLAASWGDPFAKKLERMFEFPAALIAGRLRSPIWGDCDSGRVLPWCPCGADAARHLVTASEAVFGRRDWAMQEHACSDAFWRLGTEALRPPEEDDRSRAGDVANSGFPDAGFFFFSSSRMRGSIRCGPLGVNGWANHAHCDQLSFELSFDSQPVLVDPGTYLYSGDPVERNRFRSTAVHNTVMVAEAEQNQFWPGLLFRMMDDTRSRLLRWHTDEAQMEFAGEHSGYLRLPQRVRIVRRVLLDRTLHRLAADDTVYGRGEVHLAWWFQLAAGLAIAQAQPEPPMRETPTSKDAGSEAEFAAFPFHSAWQAGPLELRVSCVAPSDFAAKPASGWVSPRYGYREEAPALHVTGHFRLPARIRFVFAPAARIP